MLLLDGYTINLSYTWFIWGIVVILVAAVILLWYNIPQKLSKGWREVSQLQDKSETILTQEIEKLTEDLKNKNLALEDLVREIDIRREINRQDTLKISTQKEELAKNDEIIINLRREVQNIEGRLEALRIQKGV